MKLVLLLVVAAAATPLEQTVAEDTAVAEAGADREGKREYLTRPCKWLTNYVPLFQCSASSRSSSSTMTSARLSMVSSELASPQLSVLRREGRMLDLAHPASASAAKVSCSISLAAPAPYHIIRRPRTYLRPVKTNRRVLVSVWNSVSTEKEISPPSGVKSEANRFQNWE